MLLGTWQTPTFARLLAVATAVALVAGCSADRTTNPLASGSQSISLSFAVANSTVPVSGSRLVARDIQVGGAAGGARTVTITGVQAVLANLRLRILGGSCSPGPGDFKRCNYVSQTPMLVSLPVNGALTTAIKTTVPAATYSGMQLEIAAIRSGSGDHGENGTASEDAARAAFITANPSFARVSVRVTGNYVDSAGVSHPFTYNADDDADLKVEFATPVTVDASGQLPNLTIAVDIARFFAGSNGSVLDPRNPANSEQIMANIEHAFHGFRDDHRTGVDEHGESKGGGDSKADSHPNTPPAGAPRDTTHHG
ncbi:MAG: hypothetical protein ACR2MQ_16675 [Gemmatimonadaceae bacterium]